MYQKNIATATQALLDKVASPQKVSQWKRDRKIRPYITPAKINQLRRLFRYQLIATTGKRGAWFHA